MTKYERGLALVNPGSSPQQYALADTLSRHRFAGGGRLVDGRIAAMELTFEVEMSGLVTVPPGRTMILGSSAGQAR